MWSQRGVHMTGIQGNYDATVDLGLLKSGCRLEACSTGFSRMIRASPMACRRDGALQTALFEPFEILRHSNQESSRKEKEKAGSGRQLGIWLPNRTRTRTFGLTLLVAFSGPGTQAWKISASKGKLQSRACAWSSGSR